MLELLLGVIQFVVIGVICIKEVKHKSSAVLMWATLFLMFGLSHLLTCISNKTGFSDTTINEASIFVILFCFTYLLLRETLWRKKQAERLIRFFSYENIVQKRRPDDKFPRMLLYAFIFITIEQIFVLIRSVGGIRNISWGSLYARAQNLSYFNTGTIFRLLYFALGGVVLCQILYKQKKGLVISSALIVLYTLVDGGNRVLILPLVVSVILFYVIKIKRIRFKTLAIACLLGLVALYLVYAILVIRHYGNIFDAISNLTFQEVSESIIKYIQNGKGELGLKNVFYYFLERNGQFTDFGKGHTYIRMLLVYLPTQLTFGLKPDDFAITMGAAMGMSVGGSTHPTLFGDCYANFLWAGILMGAFWAGYAYVADIIVLKYKNKYISICSYVLLGYTYVVIGRGSVYNGFFDVAWGLLILKFIEWLSETLPRVKITNNRRAINVFESSIGRKRINGEERNR